MSSTSNDILEARKGRGPKVFVKLFPFLLGVVLVALAVAAYFFLFAPAWAKLQSGGEYDLVAKQDELDSAAAYFSKIKKLQTNFDLVRAEDTYAKMERALPVSQDLPALLVTLEALAGESGMKVEGVEVSEPQGDIRAVAAPAGQPQPVSAIPVAPAGVRKVNIVLRLGAADYGAFKDFLNRIESNLRLFDLISFNFDPKSTQQTINLVTYYYKP